MLTRRIWLGALLGATALASSPSQATDAPKEFRIGYQKSGIFSVARKQATIEERLKPLGVTSVRWVEFQYGPPLLEALGAGAIDLGSAGDTPPIFAQAAGAKVVYIASTPASQSAILVPQDSPICTLADLKGKKVAFAKGSSSHNFIVQVLAKAGLTYADIQPAYLNPADAAAAFARRSVEAWTVWDPYFALAEAREKARILTTTDGVLASNSFLLANRDFAQRYPAVTTAALEAVRQSTDWASQNRDKLAEIYSEVTGVDLEIQQRAVNRVAIDLKPIGEEVIAQQQAIADSFHKLGLIPKPIAVREAVWTAPQS